MSRTPEELSQGGDLLRTTKELYDFTSGALLAHGVFSQDGHRLHSSTDVHTKEGPYRRGTLIVNDYFSHESAYYRGLRERSKQTKHQRLLEVGRAVIELKVSSGRKPIMDYTLQWPQDHLPETALAGGFYGEDGRQPTLSVPSRWREDQPLLVRSVDGRDQILTDVANEPQLQLIWGSLQNLLRP